MDAPRCSVVVATCNRVALLNRLLDALREQDIGPDAFEVIVVDDASKDGTQLLLQSIKVPFRLRSFRQEINQGPAAARNLAIENAETDIIVTLDDDVVPTPGLLARHLKLHESEEHVAAMGMMALPEDKRLAPWLEWEAYSLYKQYDAMKRGDWNPSPRQFYTANSSFPRENAIKAGLFDPTFRRAEDIELAFRMYDQGTRFVFLDDAVVYHEPNRSYANWLRVPFLYGNYDVVMWRDKGMTHVFNAMSGEFKTRHFLLRIAARLVVGRRMLQRATVKSASMLAALANTFKLRRLSLALHSAIFNLQYWQGMSEALGGRKEFWRALRDPQSAMALMTSGSRAPATTPATD